MRGEGALRAIAAPLREYYEHPDAEEIVVPCPGRVFTCLREPDELGRMWVGRKDPRLTHRYLTDVCFVVGAMYRSAFDADEHPAVYDTLPGKHRFLGVAGPSVYYDEPGPEGGVSVCVRQAPRDAGSNADLGQWGIDSGALQEQRGRSILRRVRRAQTGVHEAVLEAAHSGEPILLSGQPGAGKTTLLNRLLEEVDEDKRIVTVEDTPEFRVSNENRMHLLMARGEEEQGRRRMDARTVVDVVVRARPDGLLVGEISTGNAAMALELMTAGNRHFMTTIHAGDAEEAFETFATRVRHTYAARDRGEIIAELREKMWVIQLKRERGRRFVSEVRPPDSYRAEDEAA